jgi:hypothetical protein
MSLHSALAYGAVQRSDNEPGRLLAIPAGPAEFALCDCDRLRYPRAA